MENLTADNLRWFLIFVVPGFISIKVYDLFVPGQRRDFSKSLIEAVSFSCINLALLYPLVGAQWDYKRSLLVLFVAPVAWPIVYAWILSWPIIRKRTVHPYPKAWDYFFSKQKSFWVIVRMKGGRLIGGRYDTKSFVSSYPAEEQIYLEEVWRLDEYGRFTGRVEGSSGIIISARDFEHIEFIHQT